MATIMGGTGATLIIHVCQVQVTARQARFFHPVREGWLLSAASRPTVRRLLLFECW
jgi:hypothetical protein